ncbi:hypothetical protein K438DRAFT_990419 [Mycena galopus ATCC 62051]|nr:hypothetical protein K438DRAFT_990419 [Mycena galopus ATCC 62051]
MTHSPLLGKRLHEQLGGRSDWCAAFPGVYIAECLSFSARSKGLVLVSLIESLAALVNNYAGAVAFQTIGWKYILVVETGVVWLCAGETMGRTLYVFSV